MDHALSYNRTVPNRRGVTALAELNGAGAYERRYERTKRLLENGGAKGNPMKYTAKQKSALKRMPKARAAAFRKMLAASGYRKNSGYRRNDAMDPETGWAPTGDAPAGKKTRARRGGSKRAEQEGMWEVAGGIPGQVIDPETGWAPKGKRGAGKKRKGRMTRKEFLAKREAEAKKKALAAYKEYVKKHPRKVRAVRAGRGRFTGLVVKGLGQPRRTYMYKSRSGVRHIPEYAVLGYKSAASMKKADQAKVSARRDALVRRRQRAAEAAQKRILAGRDIFSPNEGEVLSFEEWKKMHANKKRTKKAKKAKKLTKAQRREISLRNLKKARAARKAGKKGGRKKTTKKAVRKGKLTKAQRRAIALRNLKKARAARKAGKKGGRKAAPKRRKAAAPKRRKATRRTRKTTRKASPKRRRRTTKARRMTFTMYAKNGRKGRRHLRHYRRNIGSQYVSDMKDVLKVGAIVVVGYAAHRALSKLFDEYALSKVEALSTGNVATWRPTIAGAIVAAVGVPLTAYLAGKTSAKNLVMPIAAGMAASLLHGAVMQALSATQNAQAMKVAGYLSAYPDAGGRAYNGIGSYYSFQPRQVFGRGATGEYYEVLPQSGFGLDSGQLTQAAAGFGAPVMQAAAGMGAEVMQAAAGTGEYIVYGANGIGEYEEVPVGGTGAYAYDGIVPTLDQAEYALNVAEAAAGLGDLPMRSTVDPIVVSNPIAGEPGGSRAGILAGGDGIFGG